MNARLAEVAMQRAEGGLGEREPGYCQRWTRQAVEALYGDRYDAWWKPSAKLTAQVFLARPPKDVQVIRTSDVAQTRLGDLLYATTGHGGYGHVGIRVEGNRVAENSVVHSGRHGAIGTRPLAEFGFDVIVRLPALFKVVAVEDGALLGDAVSLAEMRRLWPGWKVAPGGDHRKDQGKIYLTQ